MKTQQILLTAILLMLILLQMPQASGATDLYCFHDENGDKYYTNKSTAGYARVKYPLVREKKRIVGRTPEVAGRKNYDALIAEAGEAYSLDPDLVYAVIKAESNFNPRAVSPKGAKGLMQLMPRTARELGVADPFDPASNIHGGSLYLSRLMQTLDGDLSLSLAAYNAGLERVIRKKEIPPIRETRDYVGRVMDHYEMLKKLKRS